MLVRCLINILQTIYEFTMYVTWIAFGYEHWKDIHDEIGRYEGLINLLRVKENQCTCSYKLFDIQKSENVGLQ